MSEVKIVRRQGPSLVVSSTDPFRIQGQPTKVKGPPRVQVFNNAGAGCKIVGAPAQHDMRAAGPASVGKGTPATPAPLRNESGKAAPNLARDKAELESERARLQDKANEPKIEPKTKTESK